MRIISVPKSEPLIMTVDPALSCKSTTAVTLFTRGRMERTHEFTSGSFSEMSCQLFELIQDVQPDIVSIDPAGIGQNLIEVLKRRMPYAAKF